MNWMNVLGGWACKWMTVGYMDKINRWLVLLPVSLRVPPRSRLESPGASEPATEDIRSSERWASSAQRGWRTAWTYQLQPETKRKHNTPRNSYCSRPIICRRLTETCVNNNAIQRLEFIELSVCMLHASIHWSIDQAIDLSIDHTPFI